MQIFSIFAQFIFLFILFIQNFPTIFCILIYFLFYVKHLFFRMLLMALPRVFSGFLFTHYFPIPASELLLFNSALSVFSRYSQGSAHSGKDMSMLNFRFQPLSPSLDIGILFEQ